MTTKQCAESVSNCGGSTSTVSAPIERITPAAASTAAATSGSACRSIQSLDKATRNLPFART